MSKILPWIFGTFIVVNLLLLDFVWIKQRKTVLEGPGVAPSPTPTALATPTPSQQLAEACGTECLTKIQEEIQKAISALPTPVPTVVQTKIVQPTPSPSGAKVVYISLISSGSTTNMDWTDITPSDFYFDLADYPGAKAVRWEASIRALHGSGMVSARLYDFTNKRGVDFSELETQSASFVLIRSSDLKIWRGNNLYRVQMKSINGTEAFLEQAKLRVIFE